MTDGWGAWGLRLVNNCQHNGNYMCVVESDMYWEINVLLPDG